MAAVDFDVAVIGAGVIGLAVARALAQSGREVVVVEREHTVGVHTSSRNSEVIHAGLYYPPGSRKARLCVAGRNALYEYCAAHDVPHRRTGKLVLASRPEEIPGLEAYAARAAANGVDDLQWIDGAGARRLEPAVKCERALLSPSTGIVDSHAFMRSLRRDAELAGATIVLRTRLLGGEVGSQGFTLSLQEGSAGAATALGCRALVNAAGLFAQNVARSLNGLSPATIPGQFFAKGHYFYLRGPSPFYRLVYPLPVDGGLGIHVTLDLAGRARFGPDVVWQSGTCAVDYAFDESRAPAFYRAIRSYFPDLAEGALEPGYTGIRPKLAGPDGASALDFVVQGVSDHGVPGLVNLYGIESPGLTASLALADEVTRML